MPWSSRRSAKLATFFDCRRSALVDIGGKVDEVYAALSLQACLDPLDRQGDIASERLADKLLDGEMAKKISAHLIQWHNGSAVVLRHQ